MSDIQRMIRDEVRRQVNVILFGTTGNATGQVEDIQNLFPGMPGITQRPTVHPYGLTSRAPDGTISVVARVGEHAGNRMVIGHRDSKRPSLSTSGEVILYNSYGQQIYLKNGEVRIVSPKIKLGSANSAEPVPLGTQLQTLLNNILSQLATQAGQIQTMATSLSTHMHPTAAVGAPSPPTDAADMVTAATNMAANQSAFNNLASSPVGDGKILSGKAYTEA